MIKLKFQTLISYLIIALLLMSIACNSEHSDHIAQNKDHSEHLAKVNEQGDKAMGFSHERTKHKFVLSKNGGAIQVTANDAKDTESLSNIRTHLQEISKKFAEGNFEQPMATHGKEPNGVPAMKKLKGEIEYKFEEIENGGRVIISTKNTEALDAIHKFLKFQIEDHQTGDSMEISNDI